VKVRRTRSTILLAGSGLLALVLAAPTGAATLEDVTAIREATTSFRDVAASEAAGYGVLTDQPLELCIDEEGSGGMGFHRVNGELVGDTVLDPSTPEALIYVPDAIGELELVGVEYVVFADAWDAENATPPTILGHELHLVPEPNRYELPAFYQLHAWVWRANPTGMFETWNPTISCVVPPAPDDMDMGVTHPVRH
jgi:hypothetical protein